MELTPLSLFQLPFSSCRNTWAQESLSLMKRCLVLLLLAPPLLAAGCVPNTEQMQKQVQEQEEAKAKAAEQKQANQPRGNPLTRPAKLVDRNQWLAEHKDWIEIENNSDKGFDPISASLRAGRQSIATLNKAAFEHDLQLWKNLNDGRWPTYAEYKEILDKHGIELKGGLKKGQVYAYNDQNGQITILSPPEKAEP